MEVIVVDSESTPETAQVIRDEGDQLFGTVNLLAFKENTGYTRGVNEGLVVSRGRYTLVMNPDVVILPGALDTLVHYMDLHPEVGLSGPELLNFDGTRQHSFFRFYTVATVFCRRMPWLPGARRVLERFIMRDIRPSKPISVDWLMGSALFVRMSAYERIGGMDEHLFHYFNDVDWAWSFWENKYRVAYNPHASVYHYHQRLSKGRWGLLDALLNRNTRWHLRDALRFFSKRGLRPVHTLTPQPFDI